jgi:ribosomal protein L37AE/L43A
MCGYPAHREGYAPYEHPGYWLCSGCGLTWAVGVSVTAPAATRRKQANTAIRREQARY